jgi:hypothetical protein
MNTQDIALKYGAKTVLQDAGMAIDEILFTEAQLTALIEDVRSEYDALKKDAEHLKQLLRFAGCLDCDGSGVIQQNGYPDGEIQQCRWCYDRIQAIDTAIGEKT